MTLNWKGLDSMRKRIENFEVKIGDIAITKCSRNKVSFIEVAFTMDDSIRALYTYPQCQFFGGNIPDEKLEYVTSKVKKNSKFLEV